MNHKSKQSGTKPKAKANNQQKGTAVTNKQYNEFQNDSIKRKH